jgi:hypothetical protein
MSAETIETTRLLRAWADGDHGALGQLTPRVYQELRRIAGRFMQHERPGQSIQATALGAATRLGLISMKFRTCPASAQES